jgi:hypothetical protein
VTEAPRSADTGASAGQTSADVRSGWPFPRQQYRLEIPLDARQRLAFGWLILGVVSLLVAGVFSVLLVASRTPAVQAIFPLTDFFHVALVVHVDLSVLVWFAAFAGVFWSINSTGAWLTGGWLALLLCSAGAVVMALAAFVGAPVPVMSNYIPVLDSPLFLSGLLALAGGMGVLVVRSMWAVPRVGLALDGVGALRFALNAAAVSAFVALAAFFWSWLEVPTTLDAKPYYELLFWGGGHVLQFTWTLLMFASWLMAVACERSRRADTVDAESSGFSVWHCFVFGVPDAADLLCLGCRLCRAPSDADMADALRRRPEHLANWSRGDCCVGTGRPG